MTYPTDSAGNPKVDFVWGNMPMQPNDQRLDDNITIIVPNGDQNRGWSGSEVFLSDSLSTTVYANLSVGDQNNDVDWTDPDYRYIAIPADSHTIATTEYKNYPGYQP